jgi:hypothetical protein
MGIATNINAAIKIFSFVPTNEIIFFPISGAAPVSNSALPTVIMPAIRNTMSLPKPAKAVVNGITPKIAIARQAKIDVVANGMYSEMNKTIMTPMMMSAITAGSTGYSSVKYYMYYIINAPLTCIYFI